VVLVAVGDGALVGVEAAALPSEDAGVLCELVEVVASDAATPCEAVAVPKLASIPELSTFHHIGVFVASESLSCASLTLPAELGVRSQYVSHMHFVEARLTCQRVDIAQLR